MPDVLRAEMVGNVLDVLVSPGREVLAGEPVVLLESMKMEIPVSSEVGGVASAPSSTASASGMSGST